MAASRLLLLAATLASAGALLVPPAVALVRQEVALEIRRRLPPAGTPVVMDDEFRGLIESLEELEATPATAEFLSLGVQGRWALRAMSAPPSAADGAASVTLLDVEQCVAAGGAVESAARFRLRDEELSGVLTVSSALSLTPRADTLDLRTSGRSLSVPRAPTRLSVPSMMEALHAQLSPDFRADDGVRLGLQTTYLDESIRITRCTTGKAHGECTVHVRLQAPEQAYS